MHISPARLGAILLTAAVGFGVSVRHQPLQNLFSPTSAAAQTVDGSSPPAVATASDGAPLPAASVAPATGRPLDGTRAHTDAKGRHLAPHDTFYLLEYVSVKTDKGVEGFEPGREVRLVEVHRPTHTLVVSDGRAQVEVDPAKLTNDMDIATLVRQKDQTNQARIAAYVQAERAAYAKSEKEAADATAKDVEKHNEQQVTASRVGTGTKLDQPAQPTDTTVSGSYYGNNANSGYYGNGGYGYGSPYSYFTPNNTVVIAPKAPAASAPATAPAVQAPAAGHAVGVGRSK